MPTQSTGTPDLPNGSTRFSSWTNSRPLSCRARSSRCRRRAVEAVPGARQAAAAPTAVARRSRALSDASRRWPTTGRTTLSPAPCLAVRTPARRCCLRRTARCGKRTPQMVAAGRVAPVEEACALAEGWAEVPPVSTTVYGHACHRPAPAVRRRPWTRVSRAVHPAGRIGRVSVIIPVPPHLRTHTERRSSILSGYHWKPLQKPQKVMIPCLLIIYKIILNIRKK